MSAVDLFDLLPYLAVGWAVVLVAAVVIGITAGVLAGQRDAREARDTFGADGPAQRALLSLMRDEARR
jgi:hypothetical protein